MQNSAITRQKFTFLLPGQSPTQLRADPFLGQFVLQHAEEWIFQEAERWPHPWRFLLDVRRLPPACYDFFRAAESVSRAINRVLHSLYGGATLQRDLREEMARRDRAGDKTGATQIATKLVRAMLRHGLWTDRKGDPAEFIAWKTEGLAALRKRHGKKFRAERQTAAQFNKAATLMVSLWLRCGRGAPGLCYFTDQAMADLLAMLLGELTGLHYKDVRLVYFRKLRQRLQLEHAYPRKPVVIRASRLPGTEQIELVLQGKDKTTLRLRLSGKVTA